MSAEPVFKPQPIAAPTGKPESLPPSDVEAEEFLIGSFFMAGDIGVAIAEGLTAPDFFLTQHGWIFQAMLDLYERGEEHPDLPSVESLLRERGQLDQLHEGGNSGFMALAWFVNFRAGGIFPAVRALSQIIRNKAVRRRGLAAASELAMAMFNDQTDPAILLERHTRAIEKIKPFDANKEFVRGVHSVVLHENMIDDQAKNQVWHALPWAGLSQRAPVTMDGDLIVIVGPEGSGKSSLLMNWAEFEAKQGVQTVYIHTEMNKKQVFDRRLVANHKTIPFAALQKPETMTVTQLTGLLEAGVEMDSWLKHLDYWHAGLIEESKLFAVMQRMVDDFGTRCFVLDYLNDVLPEKERGEPGAVAWRDLLARVEAFNNRNNTRVITAAQLNNEGNAYMIGKALRQKAALFLKIKPETLDHEFTFEYDGIPYQYVPGDYKPVVTVAVEKYRSGGRGVAKLLYVGPRYLWTDVPKGFDDGSDDPGAYDNHWSDRESPARLDI